jgi:8-oxo-dGTP pyrophosphatase MutT (NUDIX family)
MREVYEESGLEDVRIVGLLGCYDYDARPYRDEIHERYVYHLEVTGPASSSWTHYEANSSDGGPPIAFNFYWMELTEARTRLAGNQGDLLDKIISACDRPI